MIPMIEDENPDAGIGGSELKPTAPPPLPDVVPLLPIRGTVTFPGTIVPLGIGRPSSRKLLDESLPKSKIIAVITQRDEEQHDPGPGDLHQVGTLVNVLKLIRQQDDTVTIIVHGIQRIRIDALKRRKPYFVAKVSRMGERGAGKSKKGRASLAQLRQQARELIELSPSAPEQAMQILMNIEEPGPLTDFLAANLNLSIEQQQDLLEDTDIPRRVRTVHQYVSNQLEIAKLQRKIQDDVQSSITDSQRKLFLREQVKAIQRELGEGDGEDEVVENLRKRLDEAKPPEKVMVEARRDLDRLASIPPASPEYSLIITYLELLADLPWNKTTEDQLDLVRARRILDRDHFNLDKVKRRLIEYLAVRKLNPQGKGPILCLVGPPGVGKTSLGQSVADALGRKFSRLSFGGIRDEAEIRGHRRTYIGAMPGRIIQELRRAGSNNPVMMLDEIDKLGTDFRGDPSSALLEVLDPRQNHEFVDRYLDVAFDLSQVLFIATANYMGNVPPALRDRMEVIELPGYTEHDKLQIAKKYLVPRQLKENGLKQTQCKWTNAGIAKVIEDYTREAGVRELERQIGAVCRAIAAQVAAQKRASRKSWSVTPKLVRDHLGAEKYFRELDSRTKTPGVVVGLAYTSVGGEILFIEAAIYPGKGKITLTGHIGDVMKESAAAAMSLFKSHADRYHYDLKNLNDRDIHIHVPAGAVPKDGPSAGVAMYTAIVSLLLNVPVKPRVAMTGEITLRGLVLPIGGVKEKTLAGARAGVTTVILPDKNTRDLEEVDKEVRKKLEFVFVQSVDELVAEAFDEKLFAAAVEKNRRAKASKKKSGSKVNGKIRDAEPERRAAHGAD
ncbi:MAG: endopeptidase La [Phycisphaeraceae bacterium]